MAGQNKLSNRILLVLVIWFGLITTTFSAVVLRSSCNIKRYSLLKSSPPTTSKRSIVWSNNNYSRVKSSNEEIEEADLTKLEIKEKRGIKSFLSFPLLRDKLNRQKSSGGENNDFSNETTSQLSTVSQKVNLFQIFQGKTDSLKRKLVKLPQDDRIQEILHWSGGGFLRQDDRSSKGNDPSKARKRRRIPRIFIAIISSRFRGNDEDNNDVNEETLRTNEELGRVSIELTVGFIALGTLTALLPKNCFDSFNNGTIQFCRSLTTSMQQLLVKSFIFTTPANNPNGIMLTRPCQYILFIISSLESVYSIITEKPAKGKYDGENSLSVAGILFILRTYLFPPRYLFILGAGLKMLQISIKDFKQAFDPSIGVLALVNFGAIFGTAKWISKIVLGWTTSDGLWRAFGASVPKS